MLPRILLDTAEIPGEGSGDGATLKLFQRGDEFSIMLGNNELMNNRKSGSEEALATLACDKVLPKAQARLLIGGLGMGFTVRAALAVVEHDAVIHVAELVPAVVTWAHGPLAEVHGDSLHDPRVEIIERDVVSLINEAKACYDAILLDVDNGPDGLTRASNDCLYNDAGLRAAKRALRPGGVLAVWSAAPDKVFAKRLEGEGFETEEVEVRAHRGKSGARHTIWLATKAAA